MEKPVLKYDGMFQALRLFATNQIKEAEEECTKLLSKNPLDQAAWTLKMMCITDSTYVDELDNDEMGIAEAFLDQNTVISTASRPGTSFKRPTTSAKGSNPILRPMTNTGRPLSGVVRPMSSLRPGTMEQAMRTSRTAKTARAVSSSSARLLRLGTASMVSTGEGPFINLARLNIEKYASDALVNCQLFEYVFYHEGDVKVAHQIAMFAMKAATDPSDWYWKNQLAKCYLRMGLLNDAQIELNRSLALHPLPETYVYLSKISVKTDQSLQAVANFKSSIQVFPKDVTLLTGLARVYEQMNELDDSVEIYKQVLLQQSNNIEAIACLATSYFYNKKPEIALSLYRRIMQIGVSNAELFLNIGMCCFACQQYDFALSSIQKALLTSGDSVAADVWYNLGLVMLETGDVNMATRCFRLSLSADAQHGESLTNLGILRQQEGKMDQARSLFHSAIAKAPHLFEPHFNLALLCLNTGHVFEGKAALEGALRIFPEHLGSQTLKIQFDLLFQGV